MRIRHRRRPATPDRSRGDEGFSLVELIVVVAILGILVAVAIPVVGGLQKSATESAAKTAAANAATSVVASLASGGDAPSADALRQPDPQKYTLAYKNGVPSSVDDVCIAVTLADSPDGSAAYESGPGC